ncbi:helix-turn-helix domain-containing protein [Rubellimicrobium roseum]|uniref:Helix-turn-helix domain-containing protein n=1 Tax=Rubellimicrobium roseum TaxID=687525 RepID=A0A5C4N8K3_9RHOB|nr:helix-turn-helix domain-containing protein [Rubellimicrobium roseum]TNC61191.1 helix-turn-helix domain-containing protein [Rubellimicrobium roseum]
MFTTIRAVLSGAPTGPASQPVRRGSRLAGRCEGTFWRATCRQEVGRILLAARRFDLVGRRAGRRNGPLGHVALEVLELLGHLVRYRTGRLEPSLDYLMRTLRRSRDAVVRALAALRAHGFLDWLRRYVPTGREGRGPQLRQTSNAYRLSLPARALRLLGTQGQPVPLPDDVLHAQAARQQEQETHRSSLSLDALAVIEVDDTQLGQLLAQLGRRVQERESAKRSESRSTLLS